MNLIIHKGEFYYTHFMKNENFDIILNIPATDLAKTSGVTRDQAQKYKAGKSVPSLARAVLLEDTYNIPPRLWIQLKNHVENNENV